MQDYGFKFQIGDIVTTKFKSDIKFMILGSELEICPGGEQRKYTVRAFMVLRDLIRREPRLEPSTQLSKYHEEELEITQ